MANATASTATRVRWRFFSNRIPSAAVAADRIHCEGKRPRSITISNWSRKEAISSSHSIPGKVHDRPPVHFCLFISDVTIPSRDFIFAQKESIDDGDRIFIDQLIILIFDSIRRMPALRRQGVVGNVLQQRLCSSRLHFLRVQWRPIRTDVAQGACHSSHPPSFDRLRARQRWPPSVASASQNEEPEEFVDTQAPHCHSVEMEGHGWRRRGSDGQPSRDQQFAGHGGTHGNASRPVDVSGEARQWRVPFHGTEAAGRRCALVRAAIGRMATMDPSGPDGWIRSVSAGGVRCHPIRLPRSCANFVLVF